MSISDFPRHLFFSISSNRSHSIPNIRFNRRIRMSSRESTFRGDAAAVVWFKHDLRVDDHPGLIAASKYPTVVPLYVFDHRIVSKFTDEMLELLIFALGNLRKLLKEQGSHLMIRFGDVESVIPKLSKQVKAAAVYTEEEIEYDLQTLMYFVEESLQLMYFDMKMPVILPWNAPVYDIKLKNLPSSFHNFTKLRTPVLSPLLPSHLPAAQMNLTWGTMPTLDHLKKFIEGNSERSKDKWVSIKNSSAKDLLCTDLGYSKLGDSIRKVYTKKPKERKKPVKLSVLMQREHVVGGGMCIFLNALVAYFRSAEGSTREDFLEEGASFDTLFGSVLSLGIISRRRVHYEAIKHEKERNLEFLSPIRCPTANVAAAINYICSIEWYWLMALRSQLINESVYSIRVWRWNGYIIQYGGAGHEGPAIVLVHGFGAFMEHYRDNINAIAESGNRVWAITLLGFGKSEKPNVVYTEVMWAELLRDFIIEVVKEPSYLIGNSIGGYLVSIVAALWPALVKSIVILNSAGIVTSPHSSTPSSPVLSNVLSPRLTSGAAWLGARVLLFYLRMVVSNIVKKSYPNKPDRVDDWLIGEMLRASYDPGVEFVMESIFSFNLSIPLDYLLKRFEKRVFVIEGMRDPFSNSASKVAMLREHYRGIVIRELDAGHCPHDELPQEVNVIIQEWVATVEEQSFVNKDS